MNRVLILLVAAALLASGLYAAAAVAGNHGSAKSGHVTICHRTGSHHNPYVVISPSAAGV
jgi:ABC-type sugar transport system substrate-binding protein